MLIEAIARLLEAGKYEAIRFPRGRDLNPLRINLDLIAHKDGHYICIEVMKQGESAEPIDWKNALELEVATQALKATRGQQQDEPLLNSQPLAFDARLVLVDATPDETLGDFIAQRAVGLTSYTSEEVGRIYNLAGKYMSLDSTLEDAEAGDSGSERKDDVSEKDRLWEELRPLFEALVSRKLNPAQEQPQASPAPA